MNRMTVVGPETNLRKFVRKVDKAKSLVGAFCPLPDSAFVELPGGAQLFAELENEGTDGYGLAIAVWGSKWGDMELELISRGRRHAQYAFMTFDRPIVAGFARIAAMNRELTFGMSGIAEDGSWCGGAVAVLGEVSKVVKIEVPDCSDEERTAWVAQMGDVMHAAVIEKMRG